MGDDKVIEVSGNAQFRIFANEGAYESIQVLLSAVSLAPALAPGSTGQI
jgi:hypothetical protein